MNRLSILAAALVLSAGSTASAQVSVRAPFVRVVVGPGGTYVRAPFVRYYAGPPVYAAPIVVSPGITIGPNITVQPPPVVVPPPAEPPLAAPAPNVPVPAAPAPAMPRRVDPPPAPNPPPPANPPALKVVGPDGLPPPMFEGQKVADFVPPQPNRVEAPMSLEQFAKSFRAKEGNYRFELLNPVSKQPTTVRFTLPAGEPDVAVGPASITYRYAGRSMVKIEFDSDGATVTSR